MGYRQSQHGNPDRPVTPTGWRDGAVSRRTLALLALAVLPAPEALAGDIPAVPPPTCVSGCGSGSGSGGGDSENSGRRNIWQVWEERAQAAAEQARVESLRFNEQGLAAYRKGNWAEALRLFELAASRNPGDAVIRQNVKNAEGQVRLAEENRRREEERRLAEIKRQEEKNQAQAEYRKRMETVAALMPVIAASPPAASSQPHERARPKVPLPGFSPAQWQDYLDAKELVDRLYAKLNKEGALADADAQSFYAALRRRNALWLAAAGQPLNAADRDQLRLSLPVVVNKALTALPALLQTIQSGVVAAATAPTRPSPDAATDRRAGNPPSRGDTITNAFVAEHFIDQTTQYLEADVADAIEDKFGDKIKDRYEKFLGLAKIGVKAREGGAPAAGAETVDLIIAQMPEPMSARAEHAVEGGRLYSKLAYRSLDRFMVDAMNATGARFDSEAFWKRFDESLSREQKGVKEWTEFGE